ncbi:single-stranded DNA-binding protein [Bombiscardovia coagulans]|uniref:Single-stranded DNA-binding protein n=1 Tax=Bombiscardovia coagulans TaxID=686666 RepID=A0A261ESP8_9BIFI|nr:single-stranded DNA-binding protein [Bombiscardovia coagulans]OZG49881.1 single-stranded DNA-binding protein [Bombiscardovia coagulans]
MAGETLITMVGNLTADPEVRTTGNGGTVANFTIASTPRLFNRNTGQWEDGDALFIRCSAWDSQYNPTASNIQASLAKGMRVIAQGTLSQRSYQDKQGAKHTVMEMHVLEIGPALTRNNAQVVRNPSQGQGGFQGGQAQPQSTQWSQSAPAGSTQNSDPWGTPDDGGFGGNSDEPAF